MNLLHPFPWASFLKNCRCQKKIMGSAIEDSSLSLQTTTSFCVSPMLNEIGHRKLSYAILIMKEQLPIYRCRRKLVIGVLIFLG
jgi:hypothetical protein